MFTPERRRAFPYPLLASVLILLFVTPLRVESAEARCVFRPSSDASDWLRQALLVIDSTGQGDKLDVMMSDPQSPPKRLDVVYQIGPAWSATQGKYSKQFEREGRVATASLDPQSGRMMICNGETCAVGMCSP